MNHRLVAYTARSTDGTTAGIVQGVATVATDRVRPSGAECREQIPGYVTGSDLGPAPMFTLRYTKDGQPSERHLTASGVETVGKVVMRVSERTGSISDIEVLDANGHDATFDFACFRN